MQIMVNGIEVSVTKKAIKNMHLYALLVFFMAQRRAHAYIGHAV